MVQEGRETILHSVLVFVRGVRGCQLDGPCGGISSGPVRH